MDSHFKAPIQRWSLTTQAIFAETAFWLSSMVLWVPILVWTSIFYPASWMWAAAIGISGLSWWLAQPSIDIQGSRVQRTEAPLLYQTLDDLSKNLDAPRIDEVVLNDSLNAGAYESRGFMSLIGVRRTLIVGVPLLRMLNPAEARAVIAHELGHFSSRHGKLGHWIYLVRAKWMAYLYLADAGDSSIDSLRHTLAERFLPGFIKRSADWSRGCEFQADAVAASLAQGASALVSGLTKLAVINGATQTDLARHFMALQVETPEAPGNYWDIVSMVAARFAPSLDDPAWAESLESAPRPDDSHPPLIERARALGCSVAPPMWDSRTNAGEELLGQAWTAHHEACNARWRQRNQNIWRLQHLRLAAAQNLDATVLPPEQLKLRQLIQDDDVQLNEKTLSALRDFERERPAFALASYSLGVALLGRGLKEGVKYIRKAIRQDERLAIRGYETLLGFFYAYGTPSQIRHCNEQLCLASAQIQAPHDSIASHLMEAPISSLHPSTLKLLRRALCDETAINGLWVVRTKLQNAKDSGHPTCIALVRMDPSASAGDPAKEEMLVRDVRSCLESLTDPSELVICTLWFTTEAANPKLWAKLEALDGAEVLSPRTPIRSDILKMDLA